MAAATGLDIGHQTVRAIVLERARHGVRVRAYGEASRFTSEGEPKPMATVLKELDAKVGFKGQVVCANNDLSVLVRFLTTLPLPPDRLARLLRLELSQNADASGDLAADTTVVPLPSDEILHCCILAQPTQVYTGLIDLRDAGVADPSIHFAPAAIYNTTLQMPVVHDSEVGLLIDIGANATGVTLFGDERFLACRQVNVGGEMFTDALVAGGMNRHAAEHHKRQGLASPTVAAKEIDEFNLMLDETIADPPAGSTVIEPATPATPPAAPAAPTAPAAALIASTSGPSEDAVPDLFADDPPIVTPAKAPTPPTPPAPLSVPSSSLLTDSHELFIIDENPSSSAIPPKPIVAPVAATPPAPAPARPDTVAPAPASASLLAPDAPASSSAAPSAVAVADQALDPMLQRSAEALYGQIVSSLVWFKSQLKIRNLDPKLIVLAGAGSAVPGLAAYLSKRFSAPVQYSDPFAAIEEGLKPERPHEWAAAMGLALSAPALKQRGAMGLDLRPETLIKRTLWRTRLIWPYVAAACLLVTAVFAMLTLHTSYAAQQDEIQAYARFQSTYDSDKKTLDDLDADKNNLQTDLRAIASRLYAGRDILYTLVALKERTRESPNLWVITLATHSVGKDTDTTGEMASIGDVIKDRGDRNLTIDRGAVDISGKVKFESASTSRARNDFLTAWREAILVATPDTVYPLFRDAHETQNEQDKKSKDSGEFLWGARFFFQPTQLSQVMATTAIPATGQGHATPGTAGP